MSSKETGSKDIVLPIMGLTGAGKSTFINVAVGEIVTQVGHGTTSCTKHPVPIIIDPIPNYPELEGYRLVLLDTPGFDDTHEEDVEILKRIVQWLQAARHKGAIVGGVLYLHDISTRRFTRPARQNLLRAFRLCGEDALRKTVLVTTNWTSDCDAVLEAREKEMRDEYWKTLDVHRFQGDRPSAWNVIDLLLRSIPSILSRDADLQIHISNKSQEVGQELRSKPSPKDIKPGPKDIILPIMGPTGAGKSTFINIAVGQVVTRVGHGTTSCTKHPFPIFIDPIPGYPQLKGYRLVLLDTPSFDDTHEQDEEILKRVGKWLEASRRKGAVVGGVLYFHDISAKRFTGTARQNLRIFSRLCGYDAMQMTVLVTTNWPSDLNDVLERREEEMKGEHWKTLIEKGLDVRRFQRDSDSAWDIINHLLQGVPSILADNRLDLQIQKELIKLQISIPETEAGQELRYTLKQLLKMQEESKRFLKVFGIKLAK